MAFHYIALNADPNLEPYLRRAREERAAAVYASWRSLVRFLGRLAERIAAARRAARTRAELAALSDRQLDDIGLVRSEIPGIAGAVAEQPAGTRASLADLPRLREAAADRAAEARRGRPAPQMGTDVARGTDRDRRRAA